MSLYARLLPRAKAWSITIDKRLRQFFLGLEAANDDVKDFADSVYDDISPETTRELPAWERQFGLRNTGLTDIQRRIRLASTWSSTGGQSPRYIQDTLQANGFDVYVHEWWSETDVPGAAMDAGEPLAEAGEPFAEAGTTSTFGVPAVGQKYCVPARSPLLYLEGNDSAMDAGEPLAEAGEPFAEAGNTPPQEGYVLVNKIASTRINRSTGCGEPLMRCGEPTASCGEFFGFVTEFKQYDIPADADKHHYFFYIGGETFPDLATVPLARKDEFEELCLKICPAHLWLGMLVKYE